MTATTSPYWDEVAHQASMEYAARLGAVQFRADTKVYSRWRLPCAITEDDLIHGYRREGGVCDEGRPARASDGQS